MPQFSPCPGVHVATHAASRPPHSPTPPRSGLPSSIGNPATTPILPAAFAPSPLSCILRDLSAAEFTIARTLVRRSPVITRWVTEELCGNDPNAPLQASWLMHLLDGGSDTARQHALSERLAALIRSQCPDDPVAQSGDSQAISKAFAADWLQPVVRALCSTYAQIRAIQARYDKRPFSTLWHLRKTLQGPAPDDVATALDVLLAESAQLDSLPYLDDPGDLLINPLFWLLGDGLNRPRALVRAHPITAALAMDPSGADGADGPDSAQLVKMLLTSGRWIDAGSPCFRHLSALNRTLSRRLHDQGRQADLRATTDAVLDGIRPVLLRLEALDDLIQTADRLAGEAAASAMEQLRDWMRLRPTQGDATLDLRTALETFIAAQEASGRVPFAGDEPNSIDNPLNALPDAETEIPRRLVDLYPEVTDMAAAHVRMDDNVGATLAPLVMALLRAGPALNDEDPALRDFLGELYSILQQQLALSGHPADRAALEATLLVKARPMLAQLREGATLIETADMWASVDTEIRLPRLQQMLVEDASEGFSAALEAFIATYAEAGYDPELSPFLSSDNALPGQGDFMADARAFHRELRDAVAAGAHLPPPEVLRVRGWRSAMTVLLYASALLPLWPIAPSTPVGSRPPSTP